MTTVSGLRGVDLFCGAGGWAEGMLQLGIRLLGIELDADACATHDAAGHATLQADIYELDPNDFAPCEMVIGSPPCPTFSAAGKGSGRQVVHVILECADALSDGRDTRAGAREEAYVILLPLAEADETAKAKRKGREPDLAKAERLARRDANLSLLVVEPIRWILALRPAHAALEQVPAVLPIWEHFALILQRHGYSAQAFKLSAEQYGVPQTRERAFLVASTAGPARSPEATHQRYIAPPKPRQETLFAPPEQERISAPEDEHLLPWISMAEALGWGMTERPTHTVTSGGTSGGGGIETFGSASTRATIEAEREAGRWIDDRSTGQRGSADHQVEDAHRDVEYVNGNRPNACRRAATEPAPTLHFGAAMNDVRWYDRRQGKTSGGVRRMSEPIPDTEPAPTLAASGLATGRDRWLVSTKQNSAQAGGTTEAFTRDIEEPSPTVTGTTNRWTVDRPAPTVTTTRRSKDGLLIGRQLGEGEGENVGGWGWERPAVSVNGDRGNRASGHRDREGGERQYENAVRVTLQEAAILQSYRPDYPWHGSRTATFTQVGNSVPPLLARAVIAALTGSTR